MSFNLQKLFTGLIAFCLLALFGSNVLAEPGLFWKVESPTGKTSYLFGTMHTDDNRVTNFSPAVNHALASVDVFMVETLAPSDSSVLMMPDGDLKNILSKKELAKVYALAEFHVMQRKAVTHMKPWVLAVVFGSPRPLTPFAQDNLLMTKSADLGKEVIGIESAQEHFGVMDSFSRDEQVVMLRAVLKRTQIAKEHDYDKLMAAYLAGDSDKIAALDDKITGGMLPPALWMKMRIKLLDERNVIMAQRIVDEAADKNVFAAVGASHLAGKGGLIARLKDAGYKLTAIKQ